MAPKVSSSFTRPVKPGKCLWVFVGGCGCFWVFVGVCGCL